ncbi:MAG: excinuclease ABC subunit C [Gemmatimonadetes bacterium]|nr:excinuclease ABC subunit C [Gemmatimonadota bacterium]
MIVSSNIVPRKLSGLPNKPGVYLFRDENNKVLYVGKSKSLRNRVRTYFQKSGHSLKTQQLVRKIAELETMVVDSEAEALILEANLIKQHQPYFNVRLRDDKTYPYISVTVQEPYPRVIVTRTVKNDGSRYFGPYTSVGVMRETLGVIKKLYTVRSCSYSLPEDSPQRPCLDYHIGLCLAPCIGKQSENNYRRMIEEILEVLIGKTGKAKKKVEELMKQAVADQKYEIAAKLRDVIAGLDTLAYKQRVERLKGDNLDAIGVARNEEIALLVVMQIRKGVLISRKIHRMERVSSVSDNVVLEQFISGYYLEESEGKISKIPEQVLIPFEPANLSIVKEAAINLGHRIVKFMIPQRGAKKKLVELACDNAEHVITDDVMQTECFDDPKEKLLEDVRNSLNLKILPRLIACVDISHHQGKETAGSVVVFRNTVPEKSEYRKMKIKGGHGNDDYRSMAEVVRRYLVRRRNENKPLPDLLVLDGGKGQLSTIMAELESLGLSEMQVITIAKREEELFLPSRDDSLLLERRDPVLKLFQRMRDEAHRFALNYSKKLRSKKFIRSELADVPGVGIQRQIALLKHFGSIQSLREAELEDIASVAGISGTLAERISTYLGSSKEG